MPGMAGARSGSRLTVEQRRRKTVAVRTAMSLFQVWLRPENRDKPEALDQMARCVYDALRVLNELRADTENRRGDHRRRVSAALTADDRNPPESALCCTVHDIQCICLPGCRCRCRYGDGTPACSCPKPGSY